MNGELLDNADDNIKEVLKDPNLSVNERAVLSTQRILITYIKGSVNHEERIKKLEDRVKLFLWAFALILAPLLTAIGAGVLKLVQAGP